MEPLSRAQMRDHIRIRLGKTPLSSVGGEVGQPHPRQPRPSNPQINLAIDNALAEINRRITPGAFSAPAPISISAQTADGPYRVDLMDAVQGQAGRGEILEIRHAYWYDGTSTYPIEITSYTDLLRDKEQYEAQAVSSIPTRGWIEGNSLFLLPAPSVAGTLYLEAGVALSLGPADIDTIPQIPGDYNPCIVATAAMLIASETPDDIEMRSRLQVLAPESRQGVDDLLNWMGRRTGRYQTRFTVRYPRVRR